ncbi:MAG: hypothetical protein ABWY02_02960 [Telluria sp.]
MDRHTRLLRLAADLRAAAAAADWEQLDTAARLLGPQLSGMAAQGPWSAAERSAVALLRSAHQQAFDACAQASEALGARLDEMRSNKDGWIAYTLDSETEPVRDQA